MKSMKALNQCVFLALLVKGFYDSGNVLAHNEDPVELVHKSSLDGTTTQYSGFGRLHRLFVFGDSISETGFSTNGNTPSAQNPLGNPDFPGNTTAWGMNWVGALVKSSKGLVTWNFASPGSPVDNNVLNAIRFGHLRDFAEQVSIFKRDCTGSGAKVDWSSSDSLFLSMYGQIDLNILMLDGLPLLTNIDAVAAFEKNAKATIEKILHSYLQNWEQLYGLGARNFFAITPIQFTAVPFSLKYVQLAIDQHGEPIGDAFLPALGRVAANLNDRLAVLSSAFQETHRGSKVFFMDATALMEDVIANPSLFGYHKVDTFCPTYQNLRYINSQYPDPPTEAAKLACSGLDVGQWLWLDEHHPTSPFHVHLAKRLYAVLLA
ncbi:hypothetical protein BCR37DRAFT_47656 [Protomyces lactucae-debilis]|uniref:GDSL lipase/esterase n=1 Tax=Protomyces lactucae-debilis TaxID=2754530 RepID=A0A1Y2FE24_PROLT|nr:uncharacterized protein BCR37DRAFT_47656 [Protomyces lactucae-debilis]ORY81566.1 hypothetical protein BCR37DRAFT_47656 [Protomyces lactucae-debilis]